MLPTPDPGFLRLEGLTRRFGARVAVDGLTLSIARGEIFGFLGPNGAGKSTTFQILTGMLAADSGRVLIEGQPAPPTDPRVRRRLGVVFQEPSLDDQLTGLENLRLGAALYGVTGRAAEARIAETLRLVELSDRAGELCKTYSGGMRRRLELGRVLLSDPEILIMDEPSRGVDQSTQRRIWDQLRALRDRRRLTVLVTTHQPEEASYCDRLAVLDHGRVIACDTPAGLMKAVGGDVITVETDDPEAVRALAVDRLGLAPEQVTVDDDADASGSPQVKLEVERGHVLIPRLVEQLPGKLRAVGMRPPTLGDVFVKLTGRGLGSAN